MITEKQNIFYPADAFSKSCFTDKPLPDKNKKYHISISAAEPIADALCAGLITALQESDYGYDIEFFGMGGTKMAQAGCLRASIW